MAGAHLQTLDSPVWRRPAVIVGMVLLAVFAVLLVLVSIDSSAEWLQENVDDLWHDEVVADAGPVAVRISEAFALVGRFPVSWLAWIALVVVLLAQGRRREAVLVALAAVAVHVGVALLKVVVARPRPPDPAADTGGYSFPSGHAAWAASFGAALVLCLAPRRRRVLAWILAVAFALVMAWSRTVLSVHWLTDVIAGVAWSAGIILVVLASRADPGVKGEPAQR